MTFEESTGGQRSESDVKRPGVRTIRTKYLSLVSTPRSGDSKTPVPSAPEDVTLSSGLPGHRHSNVHNVYTSYICITKNINKL